ncbi:tyrosine-type recombinase/integrase [Asticcacaulis sp. SL142]|uniref:tyrosine-type recombinase/integrase n=1 Tax=Asticcacaulis sp. SL142 TaxID=2995155 RepID=UPI00226D2CF3|nr:tyrosine-type recombinase/integrase [Asticcacaulis sp. SL142]WAC49402.1 tyrosine-type recombinase/integrase [Asticcacaulis sp. SL142]
MALKDTHIRAAKPLDKQYKMYDEGGLVLLVRPYGQKLWRLKYRFRGIEYQLSLGTYPATGLKDARKRRDEAKELLESGVNPGVEKKREALNARLVATNTFGIIAREFSEKLLKEGIAPATKARNDRCIIQLDDDLGHRPVAEIEAYELLAALKKYERRGLHETAHRIRSFATRVFRYAIYTGRAKVNPAADLAGALVTHKKKHLAAITDPLEFGQLLRTIETPDKYALTTLALRLTPHLFVRPGELRHMEWSELDFERNVWRIPGAKMKMRTEHVVPLSRQALEILDEAKLHGGHSKYVFPSIRSGLRPMSENTVTAALRRLGISGDEMTAHGFRSTASTLLNETGCWSPDAIERSLAHKGADKVRVIYHRGVHWKERVAMAQWWSDYIDNLRAGKDKYPPVPRWIRIEYESDAPTNERETDDTDARSLEGV